MLIYVQRNSEQIPMINISHRTLPLSARSFAGGGPAISRKIVPMSQGKLRPEVYPITLKIFRWPDYDGARPLDVSCEVRPLATNAISVRMPGNSCVMHPLLNLRPELHIFGADSPPEQLTDLMLRTQQTHYLPYLLHHFLCWEQQLQRAETCIHATRIASC